MKLLDSVCAWGPLLQKMAGNTALLEAASRDNVWFTLGMQRRAIDALLPWFDPGNLEAFLSRYPHPTHSKRIGLILAGNLPLVGLHDLLMVLLAGHTAIVKPSSKDHRLLEALVAASPPDLQRQVEFVTGIPNGGIDALIGTGSDATAQTLAAAYAGTPMQLRGSRYSVAVLDGRESETELAGLAEDVLAYHGLGCRSVSVVMVPQGYDPVRLASALQNFPAQDLAPQWAESLRYEKALAKMLGKGIDGIDRIALQWGTRLQPAKFGSLSLLVYDHLTAAIQGLQSASDRLQVVVTRLASVDFEGLPVQVAPLGAAQHPALHDFADGIDTLEWLSRI